MIMGTDLRVAGFMQNLLWASSIGNIMALIGMVMKTLLIIHEEYVECAAVSLVNISVLGVVGLINIVFLDLGAIGYGLSILIYGIFTLISSSWLAKFSFKRKELCSHREGAHNDSDLKDDNFILKILNETEGNQGLLRIKLNQVFNMYAINMVPQICIRNNLMGGMFKKSIQSYFSNTQIFCILTMYPNIVALVSSDSEVLYFRWVVRFAAIIFVLCYVLYIYPRNLICYGLGDLMYEQKDKEHRLEAAQKGQTTESKDRLVVRMAAIEDRLVVMRKLSLNYFMHWSYTTLGLSLLMVILLCIYSGNYNFVNMLLSFMYFMVLSYNTYFIGVLRILDYKNFVVIFNAVIALIMSPIILYFIGFKSNLFNMGGLHDAFLIVIFEGLFRLSIYFVVARYAADWSRESAFFKSNIEKYRK